MNKFCTKLIFFTSIVTVSVAGADAQDKNEAKANLDKLRHEITSMQEQFASQNAKEKSLFQNLQEIDHEISLYEKLIDSLKKNEKNTGWKISQNRREINKLRFTLKNLKKEYAQRAVSYYKYGRRKPLEHLIETGSVSRAAALGKYYKILADRDKRMMDDIKDKTEHVRLVNQNLRDNIGEKKALIVSKENETNVLKNKKVSREKLLNIVKEDKNKTLALLAEKKKSEKYLLAVINKITNDKNDKATAAMVNTFPRFSAEKGKLPWPADGRLISRMGIESDPQTKTKTENKGIEILTQFGTNVKAVTRGRVSIIKWLPWYGQTIFVQHAEGFYTVYARLSEINVQLDDIVEQNQVIAKVGRESATMESKLNFQIWKGSDNLDPQKWLAKQTPQIMMSSASSKKNQFKN